MATAEIDWRSALLEHIGRPDAPRVMTFADLRAEAKQIRPTITDMTLRAEMDGAKGGILGKNDALSRVYNGLFLNLLLKPTPRPAEAARFIRGGAVISLFAAFSDAGVVPQRAQYTTCVVPISSSMKPNLGKVSTKCGHEFRFYGLPERFFPPVGGTVQELFDPSKECPTFVPEKALLDWLYLGASKNSNVIAPPLCIDPTRLDFDRARRLADQLGMRELLDDYIARGLDCLWKGAGRDPEPAAAAKASPVAAPMPAPTAPAAVLIEKAAQVIQPVVIPRRKLF